jgi:hypothetical protein
VTEGVVGDLVTVDVHRLRRIIEDEAEKRLANPVGRARGDAAVTAVTIADRALSALGRELTGMHPMPPPGRARSDPRLRAPA